MTQKNNCKYKDIINNPEKVSELTKEEITDLLNQVKKIFLAEKPLVRLRSKKSLFAGDTHGDFKATQKIINRFLKDNSIRKIVFIGDFVDRGPNQIENINFLFILKLCFPNKIYLLRGNHETTLANSTYGFRITLIRNGLDNLYEQYNNVFATLPVAAVINKKIFVVHGGVASDLLKKPISAINKLPKNDTAGTDPMLLQLLWNDPREDVKGFSPSMRGSGIFYFGKDVFDKFMEKNDFELMIRAHEVFPEGYKYFFNQKLLSLFTSIEYRGMYIKAKVATVTKDLQIELVDLV